LAAAMIMSPYDQGAQGTVSEAIARQRIAEL
jgi:hypothetical protein